MAKIAYLSYLFILFLKLYNFATYSIANKYIYKFIISNLFSFVNLFFSNFLNIIISLSVDMD